MTGLEPLQYIPWIAALGAVMCGVLCIKPALKGWAGWVCVLTIAAGFGLTVNAVIPWATGKTHFASVGPDHVTQGEVVTAGRWIAAGADYDKETGEFEGYNAHGFQVDFGYYFDGLTFTMLLVVCGIGMLIAIYAVGYMKGDPGVARFFAAMALFIFAMTSLVMADNLVLLFLGWEGVGLCSYLLIGYYYGKTAAVDAAKKAFIVNRIGDLGFLVGIFLCFKVFGSLQFADIIPAVQAHLGQIGSHELGHGAGLAFAGLSKTLAISPWMVYAIPFMLMIGAFGKSAQIPLFVWLPDAMAGPTPVSALVHAATMVTAGVYLIARCMPLFVLAHNEAPVSPLHVAAAVGAVTALFAGTIALTNNDLKGVFAYSTVSQLGYMFLGLGALSATSGVFHLVTHAFFKALLFLTAGSVMHALAGTLDIRKMGGMGKHMPVTKWLMFAGCLALAGFPFTAGFFSKDEILAAAMIQGTGDHWGTRTGVFYFVLAILGLVTAFLTAFYTFRLWCIVFTGETRYEMGDEHHSEDDGDDAHGHDDASEHHAHAPHEMSWWPMNLPLAVLLVGALAIGFLLAPPKILVGDKMPQVMHNVMHQSSAYVPEDKITRGQTALVHVQHTSGHKAAYDPHLVGDAHTADTHADDGHHAPPILGFDAHNFMMVLSSIIALLGIAMAYLFYTINPALPAKVAAGFGSLTETLRGKYFIDELYDKAVVQPLNIVSQILFLVDQLVIHATVMGVGLLPGQVGKELRKTQAGKLQGYGLGMLLGVAVIALLLFFFMNR